MCDDIFVCCTACATVCVQVPEEFTDPIMSELMSEPVLLPTSGTIMDKAHVSGGQDGGVWM